MFSKFKKPEGARPVAPPPDAQPKTDQPKPKIPARGPTPGPSGTRSTSARHRQSPRRCSMSPN